MSITVGQIVYTSFPKQGFGIYSSPDVPPDINDLLVKQIVYTHWDPYDPPPMAFRAVFVRQITEQQTLFGWLVNDGEDDIGRADVPYCLGYYLTQPLDPDCFATICACLAHGPAETISRWRIPEQVDAVQLPSTYDYQPRFPGVQVPAAECDRNLTRLHNRDFIDCFISTATRSSAVAANPLSR